MTRLASARRNRANGRWRRRREYRGSAARTSARLEKRTAPRRRRRSIQIYAAIIRGTNPSSSRNPGQSKLIDYLQCTLAHSPTRSRQAAEPQERTCAADQQDEHADARKDRSDLHLLRFDHQLRVEVIVNRAQ